MRRAVSVLAGWLGGFGLALVIWLSLFLILGPDVVPSPTATIQELFRNSRHYYANGLITTVESLGGLIASALIVIAICVGVGVHPVVEGLVYPFAVFIKAMPAVALAPVAVVILGTGFVSRSVVAAVIAFFPLLVGTLDGAKGVDERLERVARTYGARPWEYFLRIQAGFALRGFMGGLKTAGPLAVVGAIVAEFVAGGDGGIGGALVASARTMQTTAVFAGASVAMLVGLLFFGAATVAARAVDQRLLIGKG